MKHLFSIILLVLAVNLVQGQTRIVKTPDKEPPFKIIETNGLPSYYAVMKILKESGLSEICDKKGIDQMDIDLMFLKTAVNPLDKFLTIKVKDGSEKMFKEIFPKKKLYNFWIMAREYLETNSSGASAPFRVPNQGGDRGH